MGPGGSCNELPGFYPSSDYLAKNYLTLPPFFSFFLLFFLYAYVVSVSAISEPVPLTAPNCRADSIHKAVLNPPLRGIWIYSTKSSRVIS